MGQKILDVRGTSFQRKRLSASKRTRLTIATRYTDRSDAHRFDQPDRMVSVAVDETTDLNAKQKLLANISGGISGGKKEELYRKVNKITKEKA